MEQIEQKTELPLSRDMIQVVDCKEHGMSRGRASGVLPSGGAKQAWGQEGKSLQLSFVAQF